MRNGETLLTGVFQLRKTERPPNGVDILEALITVKPLAACGIKHRKGQIVAHVAQPEISPRG